MAKSRAAYQRNFRRLHPEKHRAALKRYRENHPDRVWVSRLKWFNNSHAGWDEKKLMRECRHLTTMGLSCGKIKRPKKCKKCGKQKKLDAHHPNYTKPRQIRWLCRTCHIALHQARRKQLGITINMPPRRDLSPAFHARVKRMMASGKYSQVQLGRRLGVHNATISRIMSGMWMSCTFASFSISSASSSGYPS